MKWIALFVRTNLRVLFLLSLLVNLGLGVLNFVVQPMVRAAAVTSALAAAEVTSELEEKRAVAKANSREKAKARLRRVAVAVPVLGVGAAATFEYAGYVAWQDAHPEGTFEDYAAEVMLLSQDVAQEVVDETMRALPEERRAYVENRVQAALSKIQGGLSAMLSALPEGDVSQ